MPRLQSVRIRMFYRVFIFILTTLVTVANAKQSDHTDERISSGLKHFDAMVLESRQEMRQSCVIVQELIKQADDQKQMNGLAHIRQSLALWEKVQQNFESHPPEEYRQDEKFATRLAAIRQGMLDMEKQLADGKFKEALQVCSATCGLFVTMHEENGLVYAADRLFHLRKLAKKMIEEQQKSGLSAIKDMMGDLLTLRDNILLAPCPAPEDPTRCQNYLSAMKTLSSQLDELAISVVNGNQAAAENILKNLMAVINQAYGIAL